MEINFNKVKVEKSLLIERIIELKKKYTTKEISDYLNISDQTIRNYLKTYKGSHEEDFFRKKKYYPENYKKEIFEMIERGMSQGKIALELNICPRVLSYYVSKKTII